MLSGCASTKNISLDGKSPMAVVSVTGTSLVPWQEKTKNDSDETLSTDGAFNALLNKAIDGKNPEIATAVDRLDYADESFRRIMAETAGVQIIGKSEVVSSDIYEYTRGSFYNSLSDSVCATGYKDMSVLGAKRARIIEEELGAKSLASMDFSFKKVIVKGNKQKGEMAALVTMKIKILDERGREFVNKEYTRKSEKSILISSGYYKKEELLGFINVTIDDLITQFAAEFAGNESAQSGGDSGSETGANTAEENKTDAAFAPQASAKLGKPKSSAQSAKAEESVSESIAGAESQAKENMTAEEAALAKARETAANLLKTSLMIEQISQATGLSVEEVEALKN